MFPISPAPQLSVLLPVYNADKFILKSVQSILSQTFEDFELIVVNDGSRDATKHILSEIADRRVRLIDNFDNVGIVAALNTAMAAARGRYVARMDADDIALPTRFAKQKQFLDRHPEVMLVGTAMSVFQEGKIRRDTAPVETDTRVLRWLLHISNPVGHPSMMFRSEVVGELGVYLRKEFECAEDFDFSHRVLSLGDIALLPEPLMIYRQHGQNVTSTRVSHVISATASVLSRAYSTLLGAACETDAELVAKHLFGRVPITEAVTSRRLAAFLDNLAAGFSSTYKLNRDRALAAERHLGQLWSEVVQTSLRFGCVSVAWNSLLSSRDARRRPPLSRIARSLAAGVIPRPRLSRKTSPAMWRTEIEIKGAGFCPAPSALDQAPTLFVVVDTEAEFDWGKGFDRSQTGVTSARRQLLAQRIFDAHGVRPVYLVDYPIASQPEGYEPLRQVLQRHGCAIGAHLHPWVNPPFEEALTSYNSFPGNLSIDLEERKLRALTSMIKQSFGVVPLFFKAGRYGIGPNTMDILARLGFVVDFSILPLTDLRGREGPDFRFAQAVPYHAKGSGLLSLPMTRGQVGLLAPLPPRLHAAVQSRFSERLHLPGILSRAGLAGTVTLTPEGVSAAEQVQLIRTMLARGLRLFVLHYHSPSLSKHTPYVRTDAELADFLANIAAVCDYFFNDLGGLPGNPADLVPSSMRHMVWIN